MIDAEQKKRRQENFVYGQGVTGRSTQYDDVTVIVVAVDKNARAKQEAHPEAKKGKSGDVQT